jgi:hypothetical protein
MPFISESGTGDKPDEGLYYRSSFDPYTIEMTAAAAADGASSNSSTSPSNSWEEMPAGAAAAARNASITEFSRQKNLNAREHVRADLDRLVETLEEGPAKKVSISSIHLMCTCSSVLEICKGDGQLCEAF